MSRHPIAFAALLILAFAGWALASSTAQAQAAPAANTQEMTADAACPALDVVFLIDQSGSMNGFKDERTGDWVPASDPTKQREFAIKSMISMLATVNRDRCPDVVHRIAVISFGESITIDLKLAVIERSDNVTLTDQIQARGMEYTNPRVAFKAAVDQFASADPVSSQPRKRVVILVTDGQPCLEKWCETGGIAPLPKVSSYMQELATQVSEDFPFDDKLRQQELCLAQLRGNTPQHEQIPPEKINVCLRDYPWSQAAGETNTYIWVLMMKSAQDYPPGLREQYEAIASSHAGQVIDLSEPEQNASAGQDRQDIPTTENRQDVPTALRTILEQLLGVRATRLDCGGLAAYPYSRRMILAVDPYLRQMILDFYKFDEKIDVKLSYTDTAKNHYEISNPVPPWPEGFNVERYSPYGSNETYILAYPHAGIWQIDSVDCRLAAYYEPILINAGEYEQDLSGLYAQSESPYYSPSRRVYIEYQMHDQDGEIVAQNPDFTIDVQATVHRPDGLQDVYAMTWQEREQLFRAARPLETPVAGHYRLEIAGTTTVYQGSPAIPSTGATSILTASLELFRQEMPFDVLPTRSWRVTVLSPAEEAALSPAARADNQPRYTLPITVQLTDSAGQVVTDTERAFAQDPGLVATVRLGVGEPGASVVLRPDQTVPGQFVGEITDLDCAGDTITMSVQYTGQIRAGFEVRQHQEEIHLTCLSPVGVRLRVLSPPPDKEIPIHGTLLGGWPLGALPIPVRVELIDGAEHPLPVDEVLTEADRAVHAVVTAAAGGRAEVLLAPDPGAAGQLVGEISSLAVEGEHWLTVTLVSEPHLAYQVLPGPPSRFTRHDGWFHRPVHYGLVAAALMILALCVVYRLLTYKRIDGLLYFNRVDKSIPFYLRSWKNWITFSTRRLESEGDFYLDRLTVTSVHRDRKEVRVRCKLHNGVNLVFILTDGAAPEDYSSRSIYRVRYRG